jgi:zinc and cadmium transporter
MNRMENQIWLYTIASVVIVSLVSFTGALTLVFTHKFLKKTLLFLVSLAAGTMFGDAFIHLIPETVEQYGFDLEISLALIGGITAFFILEKIIHWRHCHNIDCETHTQPFGYMSLLGDGLHNFIDGMLIAGSFLVNTQLGIATTIAVILHEIPQEIADVGILLHAGMSKSRALFFNFVTALTSILGALLILGLGSDQLNRYIVPFTAGAFIYIAGADLIPELHKETKARNVIIQLLSFLVGIGIMIALTYIDFS